MFEVKILKMNYHIDFIVFNEILEFLKISISFTIVLHLCIDYTTAIVIFFFARKILARLQLVTLNFNVNVILTFKSHKLN